MSKKSVSEQETQDIKNILAIEKPNDLDGVIFSNDEDKSNELLKLFNSGSLSNPQNTKDAIAALYVKDSDDPIAQMLSTSLNAIIDAKNGTLDEKQDLLKEAYLSFKTFIELAESKGEEKSEYCKRNFDTLISSIFVPGGEDATISPLNQEVGDKVSQNILDFLGVTKSNAPVVGAKATTEELEKDSHDDEPQASSPSEENKNNSDEDYTEIATKFAINLSKAGVAVGIVAAGGPIGVIFAVGFLYVTKGWGNTKKKDPMQAKDEERLEFLEMKEKTRESEKFLPSKENKDQTNLGSALENTVSTDARNLEKHQKELEKDLGELSELDEQQSNNPDDPDAEELGGDLPQEELSEEDIELEQDGSGAAKVDEELDPDNEQQGLGEAGAASNLDSKILEELNANSREEDQSLDPRDLPGTSNSSKQSPQIKTH